MTGRPSSPASGSEPRFAELVRLGQGYWPDRERYERAVREIFARRYYTSQRFAGPLVVELQRRLAAFFGVKHVILVRNAASGVMIATHALGIRGKVIVPSWAPAATVAALAWSRCEPVFCDIDPHSQQMSPASVSHLLEAGGIGGILGVHLWGDAAPVAELEALAKAHGTALYYDASHAFGCRVGERAIASFGRTEIFSFHESNILNTGEGGCLVANDDALAARFVAMRGDHVTGPGAAMQSATSRMSEIQAAVGLTMLDDFERNRRNNAEQHRLYETRLKGVAGVRILTPSCVTTSNFQAVVGVVDRAAFGLSRDELVAVLRAENVAAGRGFHPANHATMGTAPDSRPLRNTELAAQETFELPIGARLTLGDIEQICKIIGQAHAGSAASRSMPRPGSPASGPPP